VSNKAGHEPGSQPGQGRFAAGPEGWQGVSILQIEYHSFGLEQAFLFTAQSLI
jgi:hypothetical protein